MSACDRSGIFPSLQGHLKEFVVKPRNQEAGKGARPWGNPLTPVRCDRSHPCHFNGNLGGPKKKGTDYNPGGG